MTLDLIDEKPIEQPYIVFPAQLKGPLLHLPR